MNLEPPLPPPPQPPTFSTPRLAVCHRHPLEPPLTGFCASCLRERLSGLDSSSSSSSSLSLPKSSTTTTTAGTATAALKSIFRTSISSVVTDNTNNNNHNINNNNKDSSFSSTSTATASASSSFFPELRRSKSFSGRKAEGLSGGFEPQRKSCDVRGRINTNTLWGLFNREEEKKVEICGEIEVDSRNLGHLRTRDPVIEKKKNKKEVEEEEEEREEIRVPVPNAVEVIEEEEEEVEEEEEEEEKELKMKDHIDQETQSKRPAGGGGGGGGRDLKESLWFAASVFSKKLQKWRRKQKMKKSETSTTSGGGLSSTTMRGGGGGGGGVDKPLSEMADYGYGRRSCDIDPRFSLDIGRMSFDDPRYSLDEPRASWDGYLIGRTFPRLAPMVSVVEDVPVPVKRVDNQIPVEEPLNSGSGSGSGGDNTTPGGTAQTREYYSDSSQRRRKSFDRSSSMRKKAAAVGAEMDDSKSGSNSKVSPTSVDLFHGAKLIGTDRDVRDSKSNSNSLRDDRSESFESASRELGSVSCSVDQKGLKKSSRWSKAWNIWGLINKKGSGNKDDEEERGYNNRGNVVERSFSESWQDTRKEANGESKGGLNRILRSNSSVSSRNPMNTGGGGAFGGTKNVADINGFGKKKKEEVVLERTRSARYSSADADNGLLRFYLTPLRNKRSLSGNGRPKNPQSIARRVLRLY